ncbi:transposase [Polaromonas sp. CG_9.11]|nr:transposase [Polaromonas sp. CG_9.11]
MPKLPQFPNVSLLPLPAGSPELNPAEQVWQQLRDRPLANRCCDGYAQQWTPAMPSRKSLAPSVPCARAAGQCCLRLLSFHDTGLG